MKFTMLIKRMRKEGNLWQRVSRLGISVISVDSQARWLHHVWSFTKQTFRSVIVKLSEETCGTKCRKQKQIIRSTSTKHRHAEYYHRGRRASFGCHWGRSAGVDRLLAKYIGVSKHQRLRFAFYISYVSRPKNRQVKIWFFWQEVKIWFGT